MTFPIILLAIGVGLLLIGLLGGIEIDNKFRGRTDSIPMRILASVIGVVLMIAAYYVYRGEQREVMQDGISANKNTNQTNANQSASPSNVNSVFSIDQPEPNDSLVVQVDKGAGKIEVKGTVKGYSVDFSKAGIYVFTKTEEDNVWWFDKATDPDQNGEWTTSALSGSEEHPTPKDKDKKVTLQAIIANDDDVKNAINKNKDKFVKSFNEISNDPKMTAPVTIKIKAR